VRAVHYLFFFLIAGIGCIAATKSYELQHKYRQKYLAAYTLYLGSWGIVALLAVTQFILITPIVPAGAWVPLALAVNPLIHLISAASLYFYCSLIARLCGRSLSNTFKVLYAAAWGGAAIVIAILASRQPAETSHYPVILSVMQYLLKTVTFWGGGFYLLVQLRNAADPFQRRSLRKWILILLAGYAVFDLSLRVPRASDYLIAVLQAGFNLPAVFYLSAFLKRHSVERPFEAAQPDLKAALSPLGISPREAEIIELIVKGFSNKEIASRLFISVDTVKKHSYNVYRKLGVQNRVQLSYFVQNRPDSSQEH
jgi:DNA-binding CsgD family transcriptional regulator